MLRVTIWNEYVHEQTNEEIAVVDLFFTFRKGCARRADGRVVSM